MSFIERTNRRLQADIIRQTTEQWFEGVSLKPEQEEVVLAESTCQYDKFGELIEYRRSQGKLWTRADLDALNEQYFDRLSADLSREQIQQVRENLERIMADFN